jgi:DNA-binding response OmpR family regulator
VLVADGDELVRNMARFTLERCGYTVQTAPDIEAALALFAASPDAFDVVLLDWTLPAPGAEQILQRLRAGRPDTPVVLTGGYTEAEAQQRFGGLALAGYLQKPYTATALARKIKQALTRSSRLPGASRAETQAAQARSA